MLSYRRDEVLTQLKKTSVCKCSSPSSRASHGWCGCRGLVTRGWTGVAQSNETSGWITVQGWPDW